jgi:hypothetical protein
MLIISFFLRSSSNLQKRMFLEAFLGIVQVKNLKSFKKREFF